MSDIKFYSSRDEHGYMSNFARYPVKMDDEVYKTSEHYYQSQKYKGTAWESKVCKADGPMKAAEIGRDKDGPLRKDWESVKDDVMREVVEAKFRQYPELAKQLLATGDAKLIEHTTNDSYWADGGNGTGKNMLGIILMEVRAKLKAENKE
ncbi:MAG TPA: NADAR family protein [Anaerovoracaceae bacterium]|nr:NADAR family protein [Anaerovoracaceae bacterium]